jgi:four helix bundle protein
MRDFKQLIFWKRSHALTLKIYSLTKASFPKEEIYGLTAQMRRSSSSIPTNIAEGCGRNSNPELRRFLIIASGSSSELEYQLLLAKDLEYISDTIYKGLHAEIIEIRKMIFAYVSQL